VTFFFFLSYKLIIFVHWFFSPLIPFQ
jgi:hypothetical protein